MRNSIFLIILLSLTCQCCAPRLPEVAQDLAVSALCDFPPLSGNNMCLKVIITRTVFVELPNTQAIQYGKMRKWCLDLNYLDYTGEWGNACIWLAGPDSQGEYSIQKGPEYDIHCP